MKVLIEVDPNRLVGVLNLAAMALADPQNKDAFLDDFDAVVTARNEAKRWHKYPDEKPPKEGRYLVFEEVIFIGYEKDDYPHCPRFFDCFWDGKRFHCPNKVDFWMELPSAPKEEKE